MQHSWRIKNSNHLLSSYESSELYLLTYQRSWDSYPSNNIDNISELDELIFKKALKTSKYKDYFTDSFAGDFGHCTQKGYELLAKNIADTILKDVFKKP